MAKFSYSVKQIARETLPRLIDNLVFPNLVYKENEVVDQSGQSFTSYLLD